MMSEPKLDAAVAVLVPVAEVSVRASEFTSMAAFDLDAMPELTSVTSVIPAGGENCVVAELVEFRRPWAVSNSAPGVTGVMDGARTSG